MELVLILLVFVVGLFALDVAADEVGVDSRHDFGDPNAPVHGVL